RALDLDPAERDALTGLVAIDLAAGNVTDARRRIDAALTRSPNAAGTLVLSAKIFMSAGDVVQAESSLRHALQADPANPESYGLLAQLYLAQGKMEDAKREFGEIVRLEPRSVAASTLLGVLCYATKDLAGARRWWEAAINIEKAAAPANNLAWLYAESGTNLDVALQLALTAKAKLPDQPEINDTVGWVYVKKKMAPAAVEVLELAVAQDSSNPVYHYHLGMALAGAGEYGKARRSLEKALSLRTTFDGAADAQRTLRPLIY